MHALAVAIRANTPEAEFAGEIASWSTGREENESGGRGEEEESGARFPKISRTIPRVLSPTGGTHKRAGARMSVTEGRKTDEREVRDVRETVPRRSGPSVADRMADEARRVLPF